MTDVIDDSELIPDEPYETTLTVELEDKAKINSTTTVNGRLVNDETDEPISDVLVYTMIGDNTYATKTNADGEYTQELGTPSQPGLVTVTSKFLGDYEFEEATSSTLFPVTLTEELPEIQTLADSDEDLTEYSTVAELIDGTATVELPLHIEGIWEVTATYLQQDIYKYSQLVEEVQFNRTPYFQTTEDISPFTAQVNYPICVEAQLCDSDGTPLPNKKVATKYGRDEDSLSDSDTTTTDDNGCITRCVTRYTIGETGVIQFKYGGGSNLNPCSLEVPVEWLPYKIYMSVNDPTFLYYEQEGVIKPRFYYYETANDEALGRYSPLVSKEITMVLLGETFTATTDTDGIATFNYTPTSLGTFSYTLTWKGNSTYQAYQTEAGSLPRIQVINNDGNLIDTELTVDFVTANSVARKYPITMRCTLKDESGNPLSGMKIDEKDYQILDDGLSAPSSHVLLTDDNGQADYTLVYDKEGQVQCTFQYHGSNVYNESLQVTKICTYGKLPSELVCGDICCIVGESFDINVNLQYTDSYGTIHKIKDEPVVFDIGGTTTTVMSDSLTGIATYENYTAVTSGYTAVNVSYAGNDINSSAELEIGIYAFADESNVNPAKTSLVMQEQTTGTSDSIDTTNHDDYYVRVNERAQIRVKLESEGSGVTGREIVATIHNHVTGEETIDPAAVTEGNGIATIVYPGDVEYRANQPYTMSVDLEFKGDYCYQGSSTSMTIHWDPVIPDLAPKNVEHAANQITHLEARLTYQDAGDNTVPIPDAKVIFHLNSWQEFTGITDEEGYASVQYRRTTKGYWDASYAIYNGNYFCEAVQKSFTITTLDECRLSTYFVLDENATLSQVMKQPVTWDATLMDENDEAVPGQKVTSKLNSSSYLNEVYTDRKGRVSMTYANTSMLYIQNKVTVDDVTTIYPPTLDSSVTMEFMSGENDPYHQAGSIDGRVNWTPLEPVLYAPDISMLSDTYVDLEVFYYYYNHAGVLVPLKDADVLLHLGSKEEYTVTIDSTGKGVHPNYHRTNTETATPYWRADGVSGVIEDAQASFTLRTYSSTPSELTTSMLVGKSQYNLECEHSTPVSVTLTDSSGSVLANKRIKTSISETAVSSSTSTPSSYGDVQYIVTDSMGVATRYFKAPDKEELVNGKYYFMKFEFDDSSTDVDYKSCTATATMYTTTIYPVMTAEDGFRVVGETVNLHAKLYYTDVSGSFNPITGRYVQFYDGNGNLIGEAETSSEVDSNGKTTAATGLATLAYKPSNDVVGTDVITAKYDQDYNETSKGLRMYFQEASTTLNLYTVENADE